MSRTAPQWAAPKPISRRSVMGLLAILAVLDAVAYWRGLTSMREILSGVTLAGLSMVIDLSVLLPTTLLLSVVVVALWIAARRDARRPAAALGAMLILAGIWLAYGSGFAVAAAAGKSSNDRGEIRVTFGPPLSTEASTSATCTSVVGNRRLVAEVVADTGHGFMGLQLRDHVTYAEDVAIYSDLSNHAYQPPPGRFSPDVDEPLSTLYTKRIVDQVDDGHSGHLSVALDRPDGSNAGEWPAHLDLYVEWRCDLRRPELFDLPLPGPLPIR